MKKNILIAYYSLQGHTQEISNMIQKATGGDIFEIELNKPYNLATAYTIGLMHARSGHEPSLKNKVFNIDDYDVIFIGSPIWWYTFAPPIKTFLKENNLENKIVVPFCTHAGNYGDFFEKFKRLYPSLKVMKGRDFHNSMAKNQIAVENEIQQWVHEIFSS